MAIDILMPQMGESIAEATVLKWHRKVGEAIGKDETLFEISTDKVDAEIPAPAAGILLEILAEENQTVPVGSLVARIGQASEMGTGAPAPAEATPTPQVAAAPPAPHAVPESSKEDRIRTRSSPLVRRMAQEHGLDLSQLKGSGHGHRVTRQDLVAILAAGGPQAAPPVSAAASAAPPVPAPGARIEVEPLTRMRKLISENMIASKRTSAHVYTVFEIDMTRVAQLRMRHRGAFEARSGVKLSFLPFVALAVCKALRAHPVLNASLDAENIYYHKDVHLGIAVALDRGLIVPVVRHADQLNLEGIARTVADLAGRARGKQLKPEEIQGGTFSITNPGAFGDTFGLPIIPQPQTAILGMGGITKRAWVVTDAAGTDAIAIRSIMFASLSFDHRLIDGATADAFMADVKHELETGTFGLE